GGPGTLARCERPPPPKSPARSRAPTPESDAPQPRPRGPRQTCAAPLNPNSLCPQVSDRNDEAGQTRGALAAADEIQLAEEPMLAEQDAEDERGAGEEKDRDVDPENLALAEEEKRIRKPGY